MNNVTFGNEHIGYYETVAGGAGAGPHWHGRSGVHSHMTNTRITDPEILEKRWVTVEPEGGALGTGSWAMRLVPLGKESVWGALPWQAGSVWVLLFLVPCHPPPH